MTENQTIAVDVDGTLMVRGEVNTRLVDWLRVKKKEGEFLVLWSAQGKARAESVAAKFNVTDLFNMIISKPKIIVDDHGWAWTRFTHSVTWDEIEDDLERCNPNPTAAITTRE